MKIHVQVEDILGRWEARVRWTVGDQSHPQVHFAQFSLPYDRDEVKQWLKAWVACLPRLPFESEEAPEIEWVGPQFNMM